MLNAKFAICIVIILSIFLLSLIPINDFDFWWHLKTGEYMLENKKLPDTDPFSYTAVSDDRDSPGRPQFTLQSFWLGQVIIAIVVKIFGLKGFIIMRAIVFALIGFIALSLSSMLNAKFKMLNGVALLLLALITTECLTDRPQMFSFLFAILLLYLLEGLRNNPHLQPTISLTSPFTKGGQRGIKRYTLYALPFLMLLWAQIHGGFVVGIAYLIVYLITIPFEEGLKINKRILIPLILISILITYLNPSGWQGIKMVFFAHGGSMLHRDTLEYLSPVKIIPFTIKNPGWIAYWTLIGLSLIAIILLIKSRSWSRLIILSGTAVASLISMRYTYFFAPLAVAIIPSVFKSPLSPPLLKGGMGGLSTLNSELQTRRLKPAATSLILALILVFTVAFTYHKVNFKDLLKSEIASGFFPEQASEYILSKSIPQPIFNDVNWGGFLSYRLWPEYKVFIDTRTLNIDIYRQYMNVLNYTIEGRAILEVYGIKSIITPAINPYTGEIFPLVKGLMKDDNWALIYLDGVAMIFVKKEYATVGANGRSPLPKSAIYNQVFYEVMFWAPSFPNVPGYKKTLAEVNKYLQFRN